MIAEPLGHFVPGFAIGGDTGTLEEGGQGHFALGLCATVALDAVAGQERLDFLAEFRRALGLGVGGANCQRRRGHGRCQEQENSQHALSHAAGADF